MWQRTRGFGTLARSAGGRVDEEPEDAGTARAPGCPLKCLPVGVDGCYNAAKRARKMALPPLILDEMYVRSRDRPCGHGSESQRGAICVPFPPSTRARSARSRIKTHTFATCD